MFSVAIKSGTCGYFDHDNCDWIIAEIPSTNTPAIGDVLEFGNAMELDDEANTDRTKYKVTEVKRDYNHETPLRPFEEFIRVYVIKI